MAKKKQRKSEPKPKPEPAVATRLRDLLPRTLASEGALGPAERAESAKPAMLVPLEHGQEPSPRSEPAPPRARPRSKHTAGELAALNDAYRGVRPLPSKARSVPPAAPAPLVSRTAAHTAEDQQVLARLGALVGEGERFELRLDDDGYVEARKLDAPKKLLRELRSPAFRPEATLDLHGQRAASAESALDRFVRDQHRRGARCLLVITGKGQHSEDGVAVLLEVARRSLLRGGPAQLVQAFCSAHESLGGRGALCVRLTR